MNERKSKNIVIIALCITLIFMGVGFSALSQSLTINGTATVKSSWNVKVKSIEAVEVFDNSAAAPVASTDADEIDAFVAKSQSTTSNDNVSATFGVTLPQPGDYIIYKVTVENAGTIAAVLDSESYAEVSTPESVEAIKYEVTEPAETSLAAGGTHEYLVKVYYDANFVGQDAPAMPEEGLTKTLTVTMPYKQA